MNQVRIDKAENGFIIQIVDGGDGKVYIAKSVMELLQFITDIYDEPKKKPN